MTDSNGNVPINTGVQILVITDVTFWGNFSSFHFVMQIERHAADSSNDHASARLSTPLPDVPADLQHLSGSSGWDRAGMLPPFWFSLLKMDFFVFLIYFFHQNPSIVLGPFLSTLLGWSFHLRNPLT